MSLVGCVSVNVRHPTASSPRFASLRSARSAPGRQKVCPGKTRTGVARSLWEITENTSLSRLKSRNMLQITVYMLDELDDSCVDVYMTTPAESTCSSCAARPALNDTGVRIEAGEEV